MPLLLINTFYMTCWAEGRKETVNWLVCVGTSQLYFDIALVNSWHYNSRIGGIGYHCELGLAFTVFWSQEKKEFHQTSTKNIVLWLIPVDETENYQKWQLYLRFKNGNAIDIFFVSYGSSGLVNIMTESYPSLPYTWLKLRMQIFIQFFA
jgi:hypothetical protein